MPTDSGKTVGFRLVQDDGGVEVRLLLEFPFPVEPERSKVVTDSIGMKIANMLNRTDVVANASVMTSHKIGMVLVGNVRVAIHHIEAVLGGHIRGVRFKALAGQSQMGLTTNVGFANVVHAAVRMPKASALPFRQVVDVVGINGAATMLAMHASEIQAMYAAKGKLDPHEQCCIEIAHEINGWLSGRSPVTLVDLWQKPPMLDVEIQAWWTDVTPQHGRSRALMLTGGERDVAAVRDDALAHFGVPHLDRTHSRRLDQVFSDLFGGERYSYDGPTAAVYDFASRERISPPVVNEPSEPAVIELTGHATLPGPDLPTPAA